jgi:hypothetical protein
VTVNATPIGIDAHCCRLYRVVCLDRFLRGLGDMGVGRNPPWWYHVRLAFLKSVELHIVFAFQDAGKSAGGALFVSPTVAISSYRGEVLMRVVAFSAVCSSCCCTGGCSERPSNDLGRSSLDSPDGFGHGATSTIIVVSGNVPRGAPIEHLGHDHRSVYLPKVDHPCSPSRGC